MSKYRGEEQGEGYASLDSDAGRRESQFSSRNARVSASSTAHPMNHAPRRAEETGSAVDSRAHSGWRRTRETEEERRLRKDRKREKRKQRDREEADGDGRRKKSPERRIGDHPREFESDNEAPHSVPTKRRRAALGDEDSDEAPFVWAKKDAKLRRQGIRVTHEDELARRAAAAEELERAKARREERQRERDEIDAERAREARQREQEMNADWDRKEESFHGQQHFLRQAIRLREGRPTLADALARNVRLDLLELSHDPRTPCETILAAGSSLTRSTVVDVLQTVQLELDCIADFSTDDDTPVFNRALRFDWWTSIHTYLSDFLAWMPVEAPHDSNGSLGAQRTYSVVHVSVQKELNDMLIGKSREELLTMEKDIAPRVAGSQPDRDHVDESFGEVDFWHAALGRIRRGIAECRIKELNSILGEERKAMLAAMPEDEREQQLRASARKHFGDDEGVLDIGEEAMVRAEASKGMGRNEEVFDDVAGSPDDVSAVAHGFAWNDKYRPRRPRFFNRVQTGYDWNKYNRTHYDHDNPPPKTVQGYKFNIFYPDLIDRSKAPSFTVARTDNPEVCILTFKAGPPYEDLAFRIVSRPWEHSHRRGFRCVFDRGVLQLWFNFRRLRYRR